LSVAVLFVHDMYNWRNKIIFGSWMKAYAITAKSTHGDLVKAAYPSKKPMTVDIFPRAGVRWQLVSGQKFALSNLNFDLSRTMVFSFSNVAWSVEVKRSSIAYPGKNAGKKRLDLKIAPKMNVDLDPVAPHGLIGQNYDRDDKKVIGKLDDYTGVERVIVTTAMAEGAIEGEAADYTIDRDNPFSTVFKYSRFGLTEAAPRDVNLLSGKVYMKDGKSSVAGATNDEVDEA